MAHRVERLRLLDGELQTVDGFVVPHDGGPAMRSVGTTVDKARAVVDAARDPLDRCLAARAIAPEVLAELVSPSYAANMRRVARKVHRSVAAECRALPMRALFELAGFDDAAEQRAFIQRWEALKVEQAGRPRATVRRRRKGPLGARDQRMLERLLEQHGARVVRRFMEDK